MIRFAMHFAVCRRACAAAAAAAAVVACAALLAARVASAGPVKLPDPPEARPDRVVQVVDALGQAVAGAEVRFELAPLAGEAEGPPIVATVRTNEGGVFALPGARPVRGPIDVSHADYGTARSATNGPGALGSVWVLPLVKRDTPAYERALKGLVTGPDREPVAGATVRCPHVRTPGEGLIQPNVAATVVTDADGRFSLYVPEPNVGQGGPFDGGDGDRAGGRRRERGDLIPVNSRFQLRVEAPDPELFPHLGDHPNTDRATIRLQRPAKVRTIKYERPDGDGFLTDGDQLARISLYYRNDTLEGILDLPRHVTGGRLAAGRYEARLGEVTYPPVTVTDDSPDELIFRRPPPVTYHGRVVDGETGKPLAGAFVVGMRGTGGAKPSDLDAAAWERLRAVRLPAPPDDPGLAPLREMFSFDLITRTDDEGRYALTQTPGMAAAYGLVVLDADRVPILHRVGQTKPDDRGRAEVKDLPLYAAAKVFVRPALPAGASPPPSVMPVWDLAPADQQPEWFRGFRAAADGSWRQFQHDGWMRVNERQAVFVPAGLLLRLRLETPYDAAWSATDPPDAVRLGAGESKDFGDVAFVAALPLTVRVVDDVGRPVEGAPVRQMDARAGHWDVAHNTDAQGLAHFHARPRSAGQFGVIDLRGLGQPNVPANLKAGYEVGDTSDPAKPIQIRMTAEQVRALLGAKPAAG